jgi:hypothetical protein
MQSGSLIIPFFLMKIGPWKNDLILGGARTKHKKYHSEMMMMKMTIKKTNDDNMI